MRTENPFESLKNAITSSAKVYALTPHDAWVYGIIVGWTDSELEQLRDMHNWDDERIARLKRLHERYVAWTAAAPSEMIVPVRMYGRPSGPRVARDQDQGYPDEGYAATKASLPSEVTP